MRIKGKLDLEAFQSGKVDIIIDNDEDLWILYNLIAKGDYIKTAMFRKVQHESGGGKVSSTKKKLIITIKIEEIEYCQEDDIIRIKGKNTSENEYISIGQFQTAEISKGSFFTLFKYYWDDIHIETLKNATDKTITSDVAAIIMEEGIAHLYFINNNQTVLHGKINQSIPKKRNGSTQYNKSKKNFFTKILNNLVKEINFENCKCVIIASPGFTKDEFGNFMIDEINNNLKVYQTIKNNLSKIIYCHSSSGYKQSLEEILSKPEIKKLIKDTKCIEENTIMEKFNEILGTEMDKAFFGLKSFEIAYSNNAINTVILTDNFLRKISPTTRKKLSLNLKNLKNKGIQVFKFSSQHVTGEKVDAFGGIIGILNYVVPEISELGGDDLDINDQKDDEDVKEEKNNEILEEMIKDNKTNYVAEEDDDKDNYQGLKDKKKKTKGEIKEREQNKKKNQRKKSSMDDEDDY